MLQSALSDRAKQARKHAGLNQSESARKIGVSREAVSQWEGGKSKSINSEHLFQAAQTYGVSPEWLATGKGEMLSNHDGFASDRGASTEQSKLEFFERAVVAASVCVDSALRGNSDELIDMVHRIMNSEESYDQIMKFKFEQFVDELVFEKDLRDALKAMWRLDKTGMRAVIWAADSSEYIRKTPRTRMVQPHKKAS